MRVHFHFVGPLLHVMLIVLLSRGPALAQTFAYWRFEDVDNVGLDAGPLGLNLSTNDAPNAYGFPADFPSDFPNPIPLTGQANSRLIAISPLAPGVLTLADEPALYQTAFTIEAMIRPVVPKFYGNIASQAGETENRQWMLGFDTASMRIILRLSEDGLTWRQFEYSVPQFELGEDLYFAVAVEVNASTGTRVRFFEMNLSRNGPLSSGIVSDADLTQLYNSTASFSIAGTDEGRLNNWIGRIDEVRWSIGSSSLEGLLLYTPGIEQRPAILQIEGSGVQWAMEVVHAIPAGLIPQYCLDPRTSPQQWTVFPPGYSVSSVNGRVRISGLAPPEAGSMLFRVVRTAN